jgi:hypothetical protein
MSGKELNPRAGVENERRDCFDEPFCDVREWSTSRRRHRSARRRRFVPTILLWPRPHYSVGTTGSVRARSNRMVSCPRRIYDATTSTVKQSRSTIDARARNARTDELCAPQPNSKKTKMSEPRRVEQNCQKGGERVVATRSKQGGTSADVPPWRCSSTSASHRFVCDTNP